MKHYTSIDDIDNINSWIEEAKALKENPLEHIELGKNKTLGLLGRNGSGKSTLLKILSLNAPKNWVIK